jgi:hypothetical protein
LKSTIKRASHVSYIRLLCGDPNPYVWRAIGSLLLALPIVYCTMAMADGEHLPKSMVYVLSPGFVIGLRAMKQGGDFLDALGRFGRTAIPLNMIYWSSILFGVFSLRAKVKKPN